MPFCSLIYSFVRWTKLIGKGDTILKNGSLDMLGFLRKEINMLFALTEKGQGMVEQALLLVLVAIVVIAVLMVLGPTIGNVFSSINKSLSSI